MICQRCEEKEACARVKSYDDEGLLLDLQVCFPCAVAALDLDLEVSAGSLGLSDYYGRIH